jgi:hypothetical protein
MGDFLKSASPGVTRHLGLIRPFPYLAFRAKASRRLPYEDSLGSLSQSTPFSLPFRDGTGIALSFSVNGKGRTMPDYFYFLLALSSVAGFLLIEVIARINRRRK